MDILRELERIVADVPVQTYLTPPIKRVTLVAAVSEIRRLRALNVGLVEQLNGRKTHEQAISQELGLHD